MRPEKREHPVEKAKLHPRNRNRERYNFGELIAVLPELANFAAPNIYGDDSIDFANPEAVKILNRALLKQFYDIEKWDIPANYLCPPIPGRADYIHYIADLLAESNGGKIPKGSHITCLDIGVGANCVYPIIGTKEYGWSFIGADVDPVSIASAQKIVDENSRLKGLVELRLQKNQDNIFNGIIGKDEFVDLTICNPPFHASLADAEAGTLRKLSNLKRKKVRKATLNFGGQNRELWVDGGETAFIGNIVRESYEFRNSCFWFSTNVSKQSKLDSIYKAISSVKANNVRTIPMGQGNKISRIVAWTFLDEKQQKVWRDLRWNRHGG